VAASVLAFLAFDWFHIQPVHTFTVGDLEEWVALALFLVVAVVAAQLAAAQRQRADEALRREREAVALHDLGRILNASDNVDAALLATVEHLRRQLRLAGCAILMPERGVQGGRAIVRAAAGIAPAADELSTVDWVAPPERGRPGTAPDDTGLSFSHRPHRWVRVRRPERAGRVANGTHRVLFVPLLAGSHTVGMLRLAASSDRPVWTREEERLVNAASELIGRTIERARLRQAATEAEVLRQTEDVRQAVLASVSHDLRTPLASIQASAESLSQTAIQWTEEERQGFAGAIVHESQRMTRLVENLLEMSRIEAGRLRPDRGWYPLETLVDDVLERLQPLTIRHRLVTDVPETLPPVPLDYVQIGEVLSNLIENAVKYTPPGSTIRITAARDGKRMVRMAVEDDGPGIPQEALPYIFEKFYRVANAGQARPKGTGLGLAVARGFVEAHGGTIKAESPPAGAAGGTAFIIRLPLSAPDAAPAPRSPAS
jgi:two-component system sensor histidine kinase KdpD